MLQKLYIIHGATFYLMMRQFRAPLCRVRLAALNRFSSRSAANTCSTSLYASPLLSLPTLARSYRASVSRQIGWLILFICLSEIAMQFFVQFYWQLQVRLQLPINYVCQKSKYCKNHKKSAKRKRCKFCKSCNVNANKRRRQTLFINLAQFAQFVGSCLAAFLAK